MPTLSLSDLSAIVNLAAFIWIGRRVIAQLDSLISKVQGIDGRLNRVEGRIWGSDRLVE